jgi:hypothetical protein
LERPDIFDERLVGKRRGLEERLDPGGVHEAAPGGVGFGGAGEVLDPFPGCDFARDERAQLVGKLFRRPAVGAVDDVRGVQREL